MQFQREKLSSELFVEILPLLQAHYKEIAHFLDIPFEPNLEAYKHLESEGILRAFMVRDNERELHGYAVFFLRHNLHYSTSFQAYQDIIYVRPDSRGIGARLIKWCDEQLRLEGVQVVYHHVKAAHDFGPMLERMGYELVDLIYAKRLDKKKGAA